MVVTKNIWELIGVELGKRNKCVYVCVCESDWEELGNQDMDMCVWRWANGENTRKGVSDVRNGGIWECVIFVHGDEKLGKQYLSGKDLVKQDASDWGDWGREMFARVRACVCVREWGSSELGKEYIWTYDSCWVIRETEYMWVCKMVENRGSKKVWSMALGKRRKCLCKYVFIYVAYYSQRKFSTIDDYWLKPDLKKVRVFLFYDNSVLRKFDYLHYAVFLQLVFL